MVRPTRRLHTLAALASLLVMAGTAGLAWATHELPPTCLPAPLPQIVGSPSYVMEDTEVSIGLRLELWRQPCLDGSDILVPLMRLTPTFRTPLVCFVDVVQGGFQFDTFIGKTSTEGFCDTLLVPATFVLAQSSDAEHFDSNAVFTLFYQTTFTLDIPAADTEPPPVALTGTLTGFVPRQVVCVNQRTHQRVRARLVGLSYDCTAAGLVAQSGDRVMVTIQGTVP